MQNENKEVMSGVYTMIKNVHHRDLQAQAKAIQQHGDYSLGHGLFSGPVADNAAKNMPACC